MLDGNGAGKGSPAGRRGVRESAGNAEREKGELYAEIPSALCEGLSGDDLICNGGPGRIRTYNQQIMSLLL